jgi:hypothetical protein
LRLKYLAALGLPAFIFVSACGSGDSEPTGTGGKGGASSGGGTGGTSSAGTAGTTGQAGTQGNAGTTGAAGSVAGTTGTAGSSAGATGTAGNGVGGSAAGTTGTAGAAGGRGGTTGTAGAAGGRGGSSGGGTAGGTGGSATAGTTGTAGAGGGTPPGPSGLPVPSGASNMPKPSGTPGNLTVINWAGFKAAVTYSFDDDNDSQIQNYSMLQSAGGQYTFFLWTGRSQATNAIWKTAQKDGHEIGNHTKSHDSNAQCNATDVKAGGDFIMSTFGTPAQIFAAFNGSTCFKSPASMYYFINRGVSPASPVTPTGNSDPLNLNCYIPATGQSASTFNSNIDSGLSAGGWVIYVVHGFSSSDGSYQPVDINQMVTAIKYAKSKPDMWVGSMVNVGAYWQGQKAVAAAMTSTSGSDKTYTWTLPAHFPPGHYVRVKVDGGTIKQKGVEVPWDGHGYYEIALDALSVTLSP